MSRLLSDKMIAGALRRNVGHVLAAAGELGVSPQLIRQRVNASYQLWEVIEDIKAELAELAFLAAYRLAMSGNIRAIYWFLGRYAPERGYGRRRPSFEVVRGPDQDIALRELTEFLGAHRRKAAQEPGGQGGPSLSTGLRYDQQAGPDRAPGLSK